MKNKIYGNEVAAKEFVGKYEIAVVQYQIQLFFQIQFRFPTLTVRTTLFKDNAQEDIIADHILLSAGIRILSYIVIVTHVFSVANNGLRNVHKGTLMLALQTSLLREDIACADLRLTLFMKTTFN